MRRPAATRAQRQHAREQRALLRLRKWAVVYSTLSDGGETTRDELSFAFADLTAACDAYTSALPARERRKLLRRRK